MGFIFDKIGYTEGVRILFRRSSATLLAMQTWDLEMTSIRDIQQKKAHKESVSLFNRR